MNQPAAGRSSRMIKKLISLLFSITVLGIIAVILLILYLRTQALPTPAVQQTSYIFDFHGEVIDAFNAGQNRQIIPMKKIAPSMIHATLAIEDHRFYDHPGIDMQGLARAIYVDIRKMSKAQGASTITQQLARNLYLNHDRTWTRKIQEGMYAIQLEMRYSKDEILEMYLNQIYYGHSAYGVQAAARMFFGKDASNLSLAESALLAGVPKGPKYYSPYMDADNAKRRQKLVLQTMVNYGYIHQTEADRAYAEPLTYQPLKGDTPSEAPYFTDYIKQMAIDQLGMSKEFLQQGGVKIFTTLDLRMQEAANKAVQANMEGAGELQAALVAVDPRTGYIKAMLGGVDYTQNQYNRTLAHSRQPGSSFKPILYLAALADNKFIPTSKFKSEPTLFTYDEGRQTYMPSNFNDKYVHDFIDMRTAIAHSDNIYAVQTIMSLGAEPVIDMARKLGIHSPLKPLPSLALGTFPISPLEMASAYSAIANQGMHVRPTAILRIEDSKGHILYEAKPSMERVVNPAHAYVLTSLMESVLEPGGTGYRVSARIKRPVAGKTGTTDSDGWMIGFTPELSTAVWVGHDQGRKITSIESLRAAPIFADFLESALEPVPPKIFPIPDGVVSVYIDPATGYIATINCPESRLEVFVKGTEPVEYCTEHGAAQEPEAQGTAEEAAKHGWWEDLKRWWNE